jgi:hypothetical protein
MRKKITSKSVAQKSFGNVASFVYIRTTKNQINFRGSSKEYSYLNLVPIGKIFLEKKIKM